MFHTLAEESNTLTSPFVFQFHYEVKKLNSLTFLATLWHCVWSRTFSARRVRLLIGRNRSPKILYFTAYPANRLSKFY
jgi:hypothetical protein